jgi:murein L,D-transpeptidase YcbB/YkuD
VNEKRRYFAEFENVRSQFHAISRRNAGLAVNADGKAGDLWLNDVFFVFSIQYEAACSSHRRRSSGNRSRADSVKHFQERHGLTPDGRIDSATLKQLNVPLSSRVEQLHLALERWRWTPNQFPEPPIIVNIPEFSLRAYCALIKRTVPSRSQ